MSQMDLFGRDAKATYGALSRAQAISEFGLDGTILTANEIFCRVVGYGLQEIQGRHHRMFVTPLEADGASYKEFWATLGRGEPVVSEFRRLGKGGREIWLQAAYMPVLGADGRPYKVVKTATDVTAEKLRNVEFAAKIEAISRAQAVIEFLPTGEIITANQNFLDALGYDIAEIKGKHHSIFVDPRERESEEYRRFWGRLNAGEYIAAEFKRIGKGGREVWIQASYNPVFDLNRNVFKVIKFATEVTERVSAVRAVSAGLANLAQNNLRYRIEGDLGTSFEQLRANFNSSMSTLQSTMRKIADDAGSINVGAEEIAKASDDLSRRTEQQAASLEETAAALSVITETVTTSAKRALNARDVVTSANQDAKASANVVVKTVAAMDAIAKSASQISEIISVIDEIAFQTNLLALNAGVEAARAGEAGRGFAVVASEVRALAQRSAESAKEIKALISSSGTLVEDGVQLVADTGSSLQRIISQVEHIHEIVGAIAAGVEDQAASMSEINTAVSQMDTMTQQNAAMAEESTAASQTLRGKADELSALINQFDVGQRAVERSATEYARRSKPVRLVANGGVVPEDDGWKDF